MQSNDFARFIDVYGPFELIGMLIDALDESLEDNRYRRRSHRTRWFDPVANWRVRAARERDVELAQPLDPIFANSSYVNTFRRRCYVPVPYKGYCCSNKCMLLRPVDNLFDICLFCNSLERLESVGFGSLLRETMTTLVTGENVSTLATRRTNLQRAKLLQRCRCVCGCRVFQHDVMWTAVGEGTGIFQDRNARLHSFMDVALNTLYDGALAFHTNDLTTIIDHGFALVSPSTFDFMQIRVNPTSVNRRSARLVKHRAINGMRAAITRAVDIPETSDCDSGISDDYESRRRDELEIVEKCMVLPNDKSYLSGEMITMRCCACLFTVVLTHGSEWDRINRKHVAFNPYCPFIDRRSVINDSECVAFRVDEYHRRFCNLYATKYRSLGTCCSSR